MQNGQLNWIAGFIWNIADDVLRDVYVRGKYRDVILPMTVIRRLDAVLEPTKEAVLKLNKQLDDAGVANKQAALCQASGNAFYNVSPFTLRDLRARAKQQQLKADFEAYLDGFSKNVQEILDKFKFRNQIPTLVEADILGSMIEKFTSNDINLGPNPVYDQDGKVRMPGLDNHAMGTIFEELIRRFNEENNEEAGEHFTPRDVVQLMTNLIFYPIWEDIKDASYRVFDGACGTGGMLTVAEETLLQLAKERGKEIQVHLFGQEVNPETYAIVVGDLLLKGEGAAADNMKYGSTLSADAFPSMEFDFMLSNPPYGKSWKTDLERMGGKKDLSDSRFTVQHQGDELSLITRSSDGQLMFLVNKLAKMNHNTPLGSRIAEVHNGSSLFTGDAGQGESNIRRWIIENDWLEAIIALPLNMFYNTGIATYIWVLTNRKPDLRKGKVQLIDATGIYTPLRKNLGKKNCELSAEQIKQITDLFLAFEETEQSKVFPNAAFGYWKIVVERPLRLCVDLSTRKVTAFRKVCAEANDEPLANLVDRIAQSLGPGPHMDFNAFMEVAETDAEKHNVKLPAKRVKLLQTSLASRDEAAEPVIKKKTKDTIEYEPDTDLRDTEQVPLLEDGGIEAFFQREVLPHVPDAWIDHAKTQIGYEISFTRHFYKPTPLRSLDEIKADLKALQDEAEGLLDEIVAPAGAAAGNGGGS
ncbi:MAG: N-6 DNA methylase [Phycisphaera sp.]|nr:N-6 DNA methylase [Phycisphaera sp.]